MPTCTIFNTTGDRLVSFSTDDFGGKIIIGRASACDVSLKRFAANNISREHIRLEKQSSVWTIVNLGHSGMRHNGQKVKIAEIHEGDVYRFSKLFLGFGETAQPSPFEVTWDAPTEDRATRAAIWPGVNIIGASFDNEITVRTDDISRMHGRIICQNDRLTYENLNEFNKSFVNGEHVGTKSVHLRPDDILTLADTPVKIELRFKAQAYGLPQRQVYKIVNPKQLRLIRLLAALIIAGSFFVLLGLLYLMWVYIFL